MPSISASLYFGLELETVGITDSASNIIRRNGWLTRHDGSVRQDNGDEAPESVEIITRPMEVAVHGNQDGGALTLHPVGDDNYGCINMLCRCSSHVNTSCGVHIHLGRPGKEAGDWGVNKSDWGPERTRTFLLIGKLVESDMFALCHSSRRESAYCRPISSIFTDDDLCSYYPLGSSLPNNKYDCLQRRCWLNIVETRRKGTDSRLLRGLSHGLGTVEIRLLGNTANPEYIKAWVNLWLLIGAYVAYLPSSLAIARCCYSNEIKIAMQRVNEAKVEAERYRAATYHEDNTECAQ